MKNKKVIIAVVVLLVSLVAGLNHWFELKDVEELVDSKSYTCDGDKLLIASYYDGEPIPSTDPYVPPTPGGKVALKLSDGREVTLPQTLSGSGVRYANADESIIFWSKGTTVWLEEGKDVTYQNCIQQAN